MPSPGEGTVEVTAETLRALPLPEPGSEKHLRGVVLVVAGSTSTPGAARLSGEAALRAGAGKLRVATVRLAVAALGVAVPEAGVHGFDHVASGDLSPDSAAAVGALADGADAVLVGPGFTDPEDASAFLAKLVPSLDRPLVLDALASEYVAEHHEALAARSAPCVLTMNPTELAHALKTHVDEVDRSPLDAVARLVADTGSVVLLGGSTKYVGAPGWPTYVVTAGGPGLAGSGSGDVQAGLVTGLLARGADPAQAAVWGAWLHASAGDRLASRVGRVGFLARELAAVVPELLDELSG